MSAASIMGEVRRRDLWPALKMRLLRSTDQGLYVYRDVLNAREILKWAASRNMTNLLPPEELHVTIVHSSKAIPWTPDTSPVNCHQEMWNHCQGLGDKGAVVAMFSSTFLSMRWQEACDAGAIWDYAGYHPHVTLSYNCAIVPNDIPDCPIELGPERMEALDTEWADSFRSYMPIRKAQLGLEDIPQLARLSERMQPALRKAFLAAVAKAQGKINLEALAAAINANQLTAAEAAAKLGEFPETYGELAAPIRAGFLVGSGLAIRELAQSGISLAFNLINPHAVQYAEKVTLDLVAPLKDNAQDLIKTFLAKSLSGETTPSGAAKDIKDLIGLDPRRVQAADNFWQKLLEEGKSDAEIERRVGRYMDALLRQRAEVIARTEIHRAAGAGQQAAWDEAAKQGLFQADEYVKVWITTWDEVLCDLCEPMDGQAVGMDEAFDTPNGPQDFPDIHPNCRCSTNRVRKDEVEDYVDNLVRPEDKPQSRRS